MLPKENWSAYHLRDAVQSSLALSISALSHLNLTLETAFVGSIPLPSYDPNLSVEVEISPCSKRGLQMSLTGIRRLDQQAQLRQDIFISSKSALGKKTKWMLECPDRRHDSRRVSPTRVGRISNRRDTLYFTQLSGRFACRECQNLRYRASPEARARAAFLKQERKRAGQEDARLLPGFLSGKAPTGGSSGGAQILN